MIFITSFNTNHSQKPDRPCQLRVGKDFDAPSVPLLGWCIPAETNQQQTRTIKGGLTDLRDDLMHHIYPFGIMAIMGCLKLFIDGKLDCAKQ